MLARYTSLPRLVYVLCLGTFINRAGTLLVPFLATYMSAELGHGITFATTAMGLFGLGSVVGQSVGGHLADHLGRRAVMLAALTGSALVMLLLSALSAPAAVLGATFTVALIGEMLRPAVQAMIADVVTPAQRPAAFLVMYVSINLGFAVGPMLGGLLAQQSFKLLFYFDAATSLAYAGIVLVLVRETFPARRRQPADGTGAVHEPAPSFVHAMRHIGRDAAFLLLCAGLFLVALVFMQAMSTFQLYTRQLGFSPATYGMIIAVNGWLIVALQMPITHWLSRFDRGKLLVVSALLAGAGMAAKVVLTEPWQFALAVSVWTIGEIIGAPLIGPIVADLAPENMRGRYMGTVGMSFSAASMIGAPLGGWVMETFGARSVWLASGLLAVCAAFFYAAVGRRLRARPPDPAPQEPRAERAAV